MSTQETLFEVDDALRTDRVFIATNRYNLLEMLGSGLIAPIDTYSKHYADLLDLAPGRVPLLAAPPGADIIALVSREDATAFPVVLEVAPSQESRLVADALGQTKKHPRAPVGSADGAAWALIGVVPIKRVLGIHFRTVSELEEHVARQYANIRHATDLYRVSPDLFGTPGGRPDIVAWLKDLDPPVFPTNLYTKLDRRDGGVSMMLAVCPPIRAAIETVAEALDHGRGRPGSGSRDGKWIVSAAFGKPNNADSIVLATALDVLRATEVTERWRPVEVLDDIVLAASAALSPDAAETLQHNADGMRAILRLERPFDGLRPGGLTSAKALLLALLRPEPLRFIELEHSVTGGDWQAVMAAALMVGHLSGRARLPVEIRPRVVDDLLAAASAAEINEITGASARPERESKPSVREEKLAGNRRVIRLKIGSLLIRDWDPDTRPLSVVRDELLAGLGGADQELVGRVVKACIALDWQDCVALRVVATAAPVPEPGGGAYIFPADATAVLVVIQDRLRVRLGSRESTERFLGEFDDTRRRRLHQEEASG